MTRLRWDRIAILAVLVAFWAGIAAIVHSCATTPRYDVQTPPARYVAPTAALVHYAPLADVRAICIGLGIPEHINPLACADTRNGQCRVYLPYTRDVGDASAGRLLQWEMARCWGMVTNEERIAHAR